MAQYDAPDDSLSVNTGLEAKSINDPSNISLDTLSRSVYVDTTQSPDTSLAALPKLRFIPGMGKLQSGLDAIPVLSYEDILWSDAKFFGELVWRLPGFFYRDLGEAGKWGELNSMSIDGRGINIFIDGHRMNDPVTGTYNFYDIPLEFINQLELISGTEAIGKTYNGAMVMNFVTHYYNTVRPVTKIRFFQDPQGTLLTDGLFTQNILSGLNLMVAFTRQTTEGRYANAKLDAWNIRTRLRYNISERLNIALTDFYTMAANGLNGGVDRAFTSNIFNEESAFVEKYHTSDKRIKRDVWLSAVGRLISMTSPTNLTIYYNKLEREYWNNDGGRNIDDSTRVFSWGLSLSQILNLNILTVNLGTQWESTKVDSTRTLMARLLKQQVLFATSELTISNLLIPTFSVRSVSTKEDKSTDLGVKVKSKIGNWLTLSAEKAWYDRLPTIQERYWQDSTLIRQKDILKEKNELIQLRLDINLGSHLQITGTSFRRNARHPVIYKASETAFGMPAIEIFNIDNITSYCNTVGLLCHLLNFELRGNVSFMKYKEGDTLKNILPKIIAGGELSYADRFFNDKLNAKLGLRWQFFDRQNSKMFDDQTISYVEGSPYILGRANVIDLFAILNIGDAIVSFSWKNILGTQYMFCPIYPMPGRFVRVGVNWTFTD